MPPGDDPGGQTHPATLAADHPEQTPCESDPTPRSDRQSGISEVDFRGEKRSNGIHASTTDPDARLYKKSCGTVAVLCFIGHALMENRSGLVVQADLIRVDGHAERRSVLAMIYAHCTGSTRPLTLGADKGYDSADFVRALKQACVTPHVA